MTKVRSSDPLQRASRSLRLKTRHNEALDSVEILEAGSSKRRGGLLAFVTPSSALSPELLLEVARSAHQHLPMVEARLCAMDAEPRRQYIRLSRTSDGAWSCVVANLRLHREGRVTPLSQHAVRLPALSNQAVLPLAVEVACRRARLMLLDLDSLASEELEARFTDELIASEAALLKFQLGIAR